MLSIALMVLKIIGIILLALLGLVLLALCLLLFVPVRYKACASAQGLGDIEADASASWLLRLVRLRYIRKAGKEELRVYIFWFFRLRLDDDEKEGDRAPEAKIPVEEIPVETEMPKEAEMATEAPKPKVPKVQTPKAKADAQGDHIHATGAPDSRKEGIIERIKGIVNQINYYKNYPNRSAIISATWGLIKKLCKNLMPGKLRLTGEVGLDSPHNTAYLFAVAGTLCLPISGIRPNFDEQSLSLDLYARGKLSLWSVLWPLLSYAIKRPIWPLTKKIILRKGDE